MNTPDDGGLQRARALFDAQVDALDGATATALRARRREAIATMPTRHRRAWWWPASGLVTAALALAVVMPRSASIDDVARPGAVAPNATAATAGRSGDGVLEDGQAEQAAQFADGALVEFENDAEFYAWLATLPAEPTADTPAPPPHSPNTPHEG